MTILIPWLATFAFGVCVFLVGRHLQRKEKEERERRKVTELAWKAGSSQALASIVGVLAGAGAEIPNLSPGPSSPLGKMGPSGGSLREQQGRGTELLH